MPLSSGSLRFSKEGPKSGSTLHGYAYNLEPVDLHLSLNFSRSRRSLSKNGLIFFSQERWKMAKSLILQETRVERSNFVLAWGRLFEVSWLSLENFLECLEHCLTSAVLYAQR